MTRLDRLLAWLWDRHGERSQGQRERMLSTALKVRRNEQARRQAAAQIERTQQFVSQHGGNR